MDADIVAQTCGESYQCTYDYSTTLSREFAMFSKYYQGPYSTEKKMARVLASTPA